jgi:hypothetical protein
VILILASGCVNSVTKDTKNVHVLITEKGKKLKHNQTQYRVGIVDPNGKYTEYTKENAPTIYNMVKVNKYYNVTLANGTITKVEGVSA